MRQKEEVQKKRRPSPVKSSKDTCFSQGTSVFSRLKHEREKLARRISHVSTAVFTRLGDKEKNVFARLGEKKKSVHSGLGPEAVSRCRHANERRSASTGRSGEDPNRRKKEARDLIRSYVTFSSERQREIEREWGAADRAKRAKYARTEETCLSENEHDRCGHWKSRSKKQKSSKEEDLSQPWLCEETDPFIARIRPCRDPPHQAKGKGANRSLHGALESMHVNGAPECMRIFGFMHGITNPDLIKRMNDNILKSMDEMISVTKSFLRGEVAAVNQSKKKAPLAWKHHEGSCRQSFDKSFSTEPEISFPPLANDDGQESPIVIEAEVEGHLVHRMYIDGGSSSEILYEHRFNRLCPEVNSRMVPATTPIIGFSGEISWPLGQIPLTVSIREGEHSTNALMNIMVVRSPSPYNGIIGHPGLRKIQVVPSTEHGMLKFLVVGEIVTLRDNTIIPAECKMVAKAPNGSPPKEPTVVEGIKMAIHPKYPKQTVTIGESLSEKGRMELCNLLKDNLDIFAWKLADMTGVPRSIAKHRLNIREGCQPIRQKRRGQAPDRNKAIQEEVTKLVEAEIMREVHYHDWLLNPVMNKYEAQSQEVHLRRGRKNVPGPHGQHERNQGMPRESISGDKATISQDAEREKAFQDMKQCIAKLRMVTAPRPKEELIMYLCTAREAVSAVLLTERDSQQMPVFFVSRALQTSELNYNSIEKLVLALVHATRRPILTSPEEEEFTYALRFEFDASNNEAEYETLVAGLRIAEQMGIENLVAKVDSRLIANQINGSYEAKEQSMIQYLSQGTNQQLRVVLNRAEGTLPAETNKAREIKIKARQYAMISGPFSKVQGKVKFLIIAIDYFTKWIEAKPDKSYPTTESSLGTTLSRTGAKNSISSKGLLLNLDMLEERREKAAVREARSKAKMKKYYNAKVRSTTFRPGDFVYRSNDASHAKEKWKVGSKMGRVVRSGGSTWEGSVQAQERKWRHTFAHVECQRLKEMLFLNSHHLSIPANVKPR
uniref:Reverse transcriptase domain-containing protein n=1 Tax=Tanacetum cinerariifolium TaxID=118510 RepID=A0A6L2KXZ9_TANCI|nr:reverse transcriptase domain-containing protein [Tanacetum cinerariifolium]